MKLKLLLYLYLEIGGDLDLSDCTNLTAIPHAIKLGKNLNLTECSNLTSLPDWVVTLGQRNDGNTLLVDVTETGLSPTVLTRLQERAHNIEGIQFHFSQAAAEKYVIEFKALLPALEFWQEEAHLSLDHEIVCQKLNQQLPQIQDHKNLLQFLIRLTGTADYYNQATRAHLARRVLQMIEVMTQDHEICVQFAYLIHQGLSSCEDRVMATLDSLGLYQKLQMLKQPSTTSQELKQAGKDFFLLEMLNKKIESCIQKLRFVDEVEVYMAFHTRLKSVLNLPLETEKMLFRKCVHLSDEEIDEIGSLVLQEMNEASFESFLMSWDPWQQHQRRSSILKWEQLPQANQILSSEDMCPYLQDIPERPVLYKHVVYDYDAFIQRYIENGRDLNRELVQIQHLFRLENFLNA